MNILGYELNVRRKSSVPEQVRTRTQRQINIEDILSVFNPYVAEMNMVNLFHSIAEIHHPISLIANRCLNANITLKKYSTDESVWDNEKMNNFLDKPNSLYSFNDFLYTLICYYLVTGNTYMTSDLDGYKTNELWKRSDNYYILPSHLVEITLRNNGFVSPFTHTTQSDIIQSYDITLSGQRLSFSPESVLHLKDINLKSNKKAFKGESKLLTCKHPISNLIAQYEARNLIYVKRGILGVLVSKDKDDSGFSIPFTEKEKKGFRDNVNAKYGVTDDKDLLAFMDKPVEFVNIDLSIDKLKPFEECLADTIVIASAYDIPRDLAINKDKSTYANQDGSEKSLYENVVIPLTNKIIKSISNFLGLPASGLYLNADFSHIPVLQEDKKNQATVFSLKSKSYLQLYNENIVTFNEMRVGMDMDMVPGMDKYKKDIVKDTDNGEDTEQDTQDEIV
jgi:hypothetical protein